MRRSRIIVLVIALAAGGIAAMLASGGRTPAPMPPEPPPPPLATTEILVAKADLNTPATQYPNANVPKSVNLQMMPPREYDETR